jgi:hypothetical protein
MTVSTDFQASLSVFRGGRLTMLRDMVVRE